jgi:hypothetical protein
MYCSNTAGPEAEPEPEDLLDELLTSIQRLDAASWAKAERMVFDKVLSGWQITAQLRSTDTYKTAVTTEREPDNGA